MNKKDIINTINDYNLNKKEFIIIGGASLVMHDVIYETKDLDIWCSTIYCNYLFNNYDCQLERINEFGKKAYIIDNIINFGESFKPNDIDTIEGIKVSSLKDTYLLKKFLNREKDKHIISVLEKLGDAAVSIAASYNNIDKYKEKDKKDLKKERKL